MSHILPRRKTPHNVGTPLVEARKRALHKQAQERGKPKTPKGPTAPAAAAETMQDRTKAIRPSIEAKQEALERLLKGKKI